MSGRLNNNNVNDSSRLSNKYPWDPYKESQLSKSETTQREDKKRKKNCEEDRSDQVTPASADTSGGSADLTQPGASEEDGNQKHVATISPVWQTQPDNRANTGDGPTSRNTQILWKLEA